MQSTALTVDEYLQTVPKDRLPALQKLRSLCRRHLVGFEESMVYGLPGYSCAGIVEVGFASQKNNLALYILRKDVLDAHRADFARADFAPSALGKGCIRYRHPDQIDFRVVKQLLIETREATGPVC